MNIDWKKIMQLIPIVAGVVNPAAGLAAQVIEAEAEKILSAKAAADPSFDRDAYIAETQVKWDAEIKAADDLLTQGHQQ